MQWNFDGPNLSSIKNLVTTEGTTLEEVLHDNNLGQSIRYETEEVIEFLSRKDIIKKLLIWSITAQDDDDPNYYRYSRISTGILMTNSIELQNAYVDSNVLPSAFRNFFRLEPEEHQLICGNYQRLVEHFIKLTRGDILDQFPELYSHIIERLHVLPFRILLLHILTDLRQYLENPDSILEQITNVIRKAGPSGLGAICLLLELLRNEKNPFMANTMVEIVDSLIEFSISSTSTPLYKTQAYMLTEFIIQKYPSVDFTKVLNKYEEKVDFLSESIDGIAIFRVYTNSHLEIAFRRFFSNISHSVLGHTCYNYIKNHEFLSKFVKENKILEEIVRLFPNEKCSGYLTDIAIFLSENLKMDPDDSFGETWKQFVETEIAQKKQLIESSKNYGGEKPNFLRAEFAAKQAQVSSKDSSEVSGIISKPKISTTSFNFNSDSDDDSSDDGEVPEKNEAELSHMIHKDKIQNLHLSSSSDDENEDKKDDQGEQKDEDVSPQQEFQDLMKNIWGFTIDLQKKKEEEDEDSYSYNEEEDNSD